MSLIALAPKMAHLMWFNKGIIILFVGEVQMFSMLRKVTIHCNMCLKCEAVYLMASGVREPCSVNPGNKMDSISVSDSSEPDWDS